MALWRSPRRAHSNANNRINPTDRPKQNRTPDEGAVFIWDELFCHLDDCREERIELGRRGLGRDRNHTSIGVNQVVTWDVACCVERIDLARGIATHIERVAVFTSELLDGCAFFVAGNGQEMEFRTVEGCDLALDILKLGVAVGTSGREKREEDDFPVQVVERDCLIVERFDDERRREVADVDTCRLLIGWILAFDTTCERYCSQRADQRMY